VVLLFKDSIERDHKPKCTGFSHHLLDARTNEKPKRSMLVGRGGFAPRTFEKISVQRERGRLAGSALPARP